MPTEPERAKGKRPDATTGVSQRNKTNMLKTGAHVIIATTRKPTNVTREPSNETRKPSDDTSKHPNVTSPAIAQTYFNFNKVQNQTDHLFIRPVRQDELDAFTSIEHIFKYKSYEVLNIDGDRIYFGVDITHSPFYAKICPCLAPSVFKIQVLNSGGEKIVAISGNMGRSPTVEIESSDEKYGYGKKLSRGTEFELTMFDQSGKKIFVIKKDRTNAKLFHVFSIVNDVLTTVGRVTESERNWSNKQDTFVIRFPVQQNVKGQMLFLGAGLLLYFMFFQKEEDRAQP